MKTFGLAVLGAIGGYLIGLFSGIFLIETVTTVRRSGDDRCLCHWTFDGSDCGHWHIAPFVFAGALKG
jgi:hypothetical protein